MHDDCECCRHGKEKFEADQQRMMNKHGFVVHAVLDDSFYHTNIHTHGLVENYGHQDFQIVCHVPTDTAHRIICDLVTLVKTGKWFKANEKVHNVLKHFDLLLIEREETGRRVLRIVFPDRDGNVDENKIDSQLAMQFFKEGL